MHDLAITLKTESENQNYIKTQLRALLLIETQLSKSPEISTAASGTVLNSFMKGLQRHFKVGTNLIFNNRGFITFNLFQSCLITENCNHRLDIFSNFQVPKIIKINPKRCKIKS